MVTRQLTFKRYSRPLCSRVMKSLRLFGGQPLKFWVPFLDNWIRNSCVHTLLAFENDFTMVVNLQKTKIIEYPDADFTWTDY